MPRLAGTLAQPRSDPVGMALGQRQQLADAAHQQGKPDQAHRTRGNEMTADPAQSQARRRAHRPPAAAGRGGGARHRQPNRTSGRGQPQAAGGG
ncbi:hypothetical protein G6F45_014211 [Rhizopus arrhizus]|nr:hypothetical protein G6F45_014211 [Rhizopus arrhizus]